MTAGTGAENWKHVPWTTAGCALPRRFVWLGVALPDPDPALSAYEVRDYYWHHGKELNIIDFKDLLTAYVSDPEVSADAVTFKLIWQPIQTVDPFHKPRCKGYK